MLHCCIYSTDIKQVSWLACPSHLKCKRSLFPSNIYLYTINMLISTHDTSISVCVCVCVCVCVWWVRRAGGFIVFWTTYRWSDKQARDGPRIQKMSHQLLIISFAHTLASSILSLIFLLCFQKVLQFFLSMIDQPSIIWWAQLLGRNHILIIYLDGGN